MMEPLVLALVALTPLSMILETFLVDFTGRRHVSIIDDEQSTF